MSGIGISEILVWGFLVTVDWQHWTVPARWVVLLWLIKIIVVLYLFHWPLWFHEPIWDYRDAAFFLMFAAGLNAMGILALYNIRGFLSLFHRDRDTYELSIGERNVNIIAVSISLLALCVLIESILY